MADSPSHKPMHRWLLLALSAGVVLLADQISKWWAVEQLGPESETPGRVIDLFWTLRFNYAENTGMAFSQGAESGRWIGLVVLGVVVALVVFASRSHSRVQVVLLGVVIGGALGNLVDRALRGEDGWLSGAVVDFIDLQWWPVFNIADAAVVVGGILLVLVSTREGAGETSDDAGTSAGTPSPPQVEGRSGGRDPAGAGDSRTGDAQDAGRAGDPDG